MNGTYRHTQRGTLIVLAMLGMSLVILVLGFFVHRALMVGVPILLISAWLFHSLTIEVTESELRWRFGPGLIRKSVPLGDITSVKCVETNFIEGWGIHLSRFGWLYNVSGKHAVAFTMKNGKRFALGTDEPLKLKAAIDPDPLAVPSPSP
jgi:hypothetical protein